MKKQSLAIWVIVALALPHGGWALEKEHGDHEEDVTQRGEKISHDDSANRTSKTGRKKRATICAECGRPESSCECGHADGGKEKDAKTNEAKDYGPEDGHKH